MNSQVTRSDKINHFVGNLAQAVEFWDLEDIYKKVQKVRYSKEFGDFCVEQFDIWNIQVEALFDYFQ